uniref:NADH-ubiquinone oxidoreductase chain 2 n=1 Tax=Hydrobasileus croceus TaxID=1168636 RepID=A0A0A0VCS9_9ODON|nr:NADH dehydrogenase subunit 2 [Hydrobasileus croceus]AIW64828.1 NADH dehydrogenase subunit 2 [Hydrobasileus croceus]
MLNNPSNFMFMLMLMSGSIISISSSSWLGMWMGLEMNLLSFIPMINKNKTPYETESMMMYFLVQAMASVLFLSSILMNEMFNFSMNFYSTYLILMALLMKMGAAPFHFWFPGVMEGIDWMNCLILMTWQKLAPLILISYKLVNNLIMFVIIMSTMIGSVGGLNQNSIRKIMAYSSINHIGWMLSAMMISNNMWMLYFIIYSVMNLSVILMFMSTSVFYITQLFYIKTSPMIKFSMMISMLSLAGLPPFLGFLPKWLVIQNLAMNQSFFMLMFMLMMTLLTLYFYMRIMFSSFMFMNQENKWHSNKSTNEIINASFMLSIIGIPITTWMILY